jgi:hypothetical protein
VGTKVWCSMLMPARGEQQQATHPCIVGGVWSSMPVRPPLSV